VDDGGLFDKVSRSFEVEMPSGRTMDDYLDQILPLIRPWSEDLHEMKFLHTRWLEVRDDEHFNDTIFVLGREAVVARLEWRDMMELMFNLYRGNSQVVVYVAALVVVVAAIIIFSIL